MGIGDDFEFLGRVVSNEISSVWKARDRQLDRIVALKSLDTPSELLRVRWREEARLLAAFSHEHLVEIYGFAESETQAFIVEEWIDGATVAATVSAAGQLTTAQALGVIRGALLGLAFLHERGIVHGDVSASNIMVDVGGSSKLIDLGLAAVAGSLSRPATGAFQAPEVSRGELITPASDVYAAAAVLTMLLRGRAGSRGKFADIDAEIRPTLARAMSEPMGDRYPDAASFLAALEESAQRHFGAAWWTQAGMGALATSAVAGLAAAGPAPFAPAPHSVTGNAASIESPAKAVSAPARAVDAQAKKSSRIGGSLRSRGSSITGVAVAGAAVAAVAAVTYLIVANNQSQSTALERTPTKAAIVNAATTLNAVSTSAAPTTAPATSLAPVPTTHVGQYEFRSVITSITGLSVDAVGKVFTTVWTFTAVCAAPGDCQTTVETAGGGKFVLPASGPLERSGTSQGQCPTVARTQTLTFTQTLVITPGPDGLPQGLVGTAHEVGSGCSDEATNYDYSETVTPLAPAVTR